MKSKSITTKSQEKFLFLPYPFHFSLCIFVIIVFRHKRFWTKLNVWLKILSKKSTFVFLVQNWNVTICFKQLWASVSIVGRWLVIPYCLNCSCVNNPWTFHLFKASKLGLVICLVCNTCGQIGHLWFYLHYC